ncbi:hypothetical protein Z043_103851, partial [Scleropages formosus]
CLNTLITAYKLVKKSAPQYLRDLITPYTPVGVLCSSNSSLLAVALSSVRHQKPSGVKGEHSVETALLDVSDALQSDRMEGFSCHLGCGTEEGSFIPMTQTEMEGKHGYPLVRGQHSSSPAVVDVSKGHQSVDQLSIHQHLVVSKPISLMDQTAPPTVNEPRFRLFLMRDVDI